ncbi:carbohydrate ABC transporter permease [Roseateles chitosanitabidus]|uniref:carbohydrate ABC transporter permease n=1 Tax=Roseateles chitosanitabidus TaxID=65048 RepID=UPI00082DCCC7|nr:sugar ABC transporter permease [Roseateles chitosanitabidus]
MTLRALLSTRPRLPQSLRIPRRWMPYLFISPFFLLFAAFGLFPLLFSIVLSLHSWDAAAGLGAMQWVGLDNYLYALTRDDGLRATLYNTLWLAVVGGVPQHLVALPLAYYLHTAFRRWRNGVVGLYFLPFITSTVAVSLVFSALFSKDFGAINAALGALRDLPLLGSLFPAGPVDWDQAENTRWMIAIVVFWRYVGWNTVLYLSAIQTIPRDLFEAARVDGVSERQTFLHIVLPQLRPMVFFAVTLAIIGSLQLFEEPFILTGGTGGSGQAGKTVAMHLYSVAFTDGDFGTASAIAWLLFLLIAGATWLNNRLLGRQR